MPTAVESKMAPMRSHTDTYLKLGDLKGESVDEKHSGEIDVLSFTWGVTQAHGSSAVGQGAGVGKAQFHEFQFTKRIDSSSAKLMLACASGQHFPEATLTCRRAGGKQAEFLKIKFENVIVSSYQNIGGDHDEGPSETLPVDKVSIAYAKVVFGYKAQNADGTEGANTQTGWDALKNVKI